MFSDADDEDTPARTASLGMGFKRPGTSDSLQKNLDEWGDSTNSSSGDLGADSHPAPKKAAAMKRTRDEAELVGEGLSRRQPTKGQGPQKKKTRVPPAARILMDAPLDIPPLRYMMPTLPIVAG